MNTDTNNMETPSAPGAPNVANVPSDPSDPNVPNAQGTTNTPDATNTSDAANAPGATDAPSAPAAVRKRKQASRAPASVRWKFVCAYDGSMFSGWQSQIEGRTLQDTIEARLREIFGKLVRTHASGRTDSGVHARGQVFHFDAVWPHGAGELLAAMRAGLPPQIQIKSARRAPADFHARFAARGKRYEYNIFLGDADPFTRPWVWAVEHPLDFAAMEAAAEILRGRHDFRAFSSRNGPPKKHTVRELRRLEIVRRGRRVRIIAEADGFLYKMVRILVGALVAVGGGKLTLDGLRELLKPAPRPPGVHAAPPQGLFLVKVFY